MTLRTAVLDSKIAYLVYFPFDDTYSYAEENNFIEKNCEIQVGKTYSINHDGCEYFGVVLEKGKYNNDI